MPGTYATPELIEMPEGQEELITSRFDAASEAAQAATDAALDMLAGIGNIGTIQATTFVPAFQMPPTPSAPPSIPSPSIPSPVGYFKRLPTYPLDPISIIIGNPPEFDITPIIPVIPEIPDIPWPVITEDPPPIHDVTLPDEPPIVWPDSPIVNDIVLPTPMSLDMPTFDAILPPDNIVLPSVSIDPGILAYDSPILQGLKDKIYNWVINGGTGLDPLVEDALWMRDSERDERAQNAAIKKTSDEWSKRGFVMANGALFAQLQENIITFRDKRIDKSRDILIKQAELAQNNTHFYLEKGLAMEVQLMDWTNKIGERQFAASKAAQEAAISICQLDISRYNIKLEIYKTQAMVYEQRIKAEMNKVEIFKAQIEAAKLTAEINKIAAEIYKERIGAITAMIQMYEVQIKAAMATLEVDKAKIDAFKALVEAYVAQVNGISETYKAYTSRIEGEKAKVQVYAIEVEAWKSRVESFKFVADVEIEKARAIIEKNKLYIEEYRVDVEADKVSVEASGVHARAISDAWVATISAAKANAEAISANNIVAMKSAELQIEASIRVSEAVRNTQEMNMRAFQAQETLRVEAAKGGALVAASLANGAWAGTSVQASISSQSQYANSFHAQEHLSEAHNFTHTGTPES